MALRLSQGLGWIGVDVGTHTVKLAQTVREGAEVRLHRAAVIQRPSAWSGDDAMALEQPITSLPEIRAALECGNFVGRDAICSLPMNACQLRSLTVPPGNEQERRTMIADELAEDWTEVRQPMEFDFWELESGKAEKGSDAFNVSVLATSRLWAGQLWRDCRKCGLDCWAIDGTPPALARALALVGAVNAGRRALVVDWGYSNTTLCVVGDDRPLYTRRVHGCAYGLVIEAIMNAFDITLDEAQYVADTQGLEVPESNEHQSDVPQLLAESSGNASPSLAAEADRRTQSAVTEAAAVPLEELVRQVRRTLQFMEAQRRHLHPTAVWLVGGGASLANATAFFQHALGIPVRAWYLEASPALAALARERRSAVFATAAALSASVWRAA